MATIIIRREEASHIQNKMRMLTGGARPVIVDWRATCDCGWQDKFFSKDDALSGARHHSDGQHGKKANVMLNPLGDN